MKLTELNLAGCYQIKMASSHDDRGSFYKYFMESAFKKIAPDFSIKEMYFSISKKNVIRGMHFQKKPHEHAKIVYCSLGEIDDVILDLRSRSVTYGMYQKIRLRAESETAIYMPPGIAHGFCSLAELNMVHYGVTSEYESKSDVGIRWDSFGCEWGVVNPIISNRDSKLPSFLNIQERYF